MFSLPTRQTAYEPFTPNNSGQRSHPTYYRGCWHVVGRCFFCTYRHLLKDASSVLKEVYNPKAVIPHAALLDQASAHCPIFPTAASRRSLGRVSVPVWPVTLSGRLPVEALVGHYPTNKLIGREHIPHRKTFHHTDHAIGMVVSGISHRFRRLSQSEGQITHVLLTRSPLEYPRKGLSARLACVKHAASVRPEPGSNSPLKNKPTPQPQKARARNTTKPNPGKKTNTDKIVRNHCLTKEIHPPPTQKAKQERQGITN